MLLTTRRNRQKRAALAAAADTGTVWRSLCGLALAAAVARSLGRSSSYVIAIACFACLERPTGRGAALRCSVGSLGSAPRPEGSVFSFSFVVLLMIMTPQDFLSRRRERQQSEMKVTSSQGSRNKHAGRRDKSQSVLSIVSHGLASSRTSCCSFTSLCFSQVSQSV